MAFKLFSLVLVVLCATCSWAAIRAHVEPKGACLGCPEKIDNTNDPKVVALLKNVMNRSNEKLSLIQIKKGTVQVVNGLKYEFVFEADSLDGKKECFTSFVMRRSIDLKVFKCHKI